MQQFQPLLNVAAQLYSLGQPRKSSEGLNGSAQEEADVRAQAQLVWETVLGHGAVSGRRHAPARPIYSDPGSFFITSTPTFQFSGL